MQGIRLSAGCTTEETERGTLRPDSEISLLSVARIVILRAQFDVDCVLRTGAARGFMGVLTTRHIQHFLVIDQFAQRDVVQKTGQAIAQVAPQRVSQAFIAP